MDTGSSFTLLSHRGRKLSPLPGAKGCPTPTASSPAPADAGTTLRKYHGVADGDLSQSQTRSYASGTLQREAANSIHIAGDPDIVANAHGRAHALHRRRLIRTAETREGQRLRIQFDHRPARCGRDVGAGGQKLAIRVPVDVVR